MIIDTKPKNEPDELSLKIQDLKLKYSPEELKSIISQFKDPINKNIARKLLDVE